MSNLWHDIDDQPHQSTAIGTSAAHVSTSDIWFEIGLDALIDDRYTPNTTRWRKGDMIIHHADAKDGSMLMVVVGYTHDGLCKTQYVDRAKHKRTIWKNDIRWLLDPAKFGIKEVKE